MSRNGWVVVGIVAILAAPLLLIALALAGLLFWGASSFGDRDSGFGRVEFEAYLGTPLPASTGNLQGYQEGFQDGFFVARFELAPGDVAAFVSKTHFSTAMPNHPFPNRVSALPAWWDPERVTNDYDAYEWTQPGATEVLLVSRRLGAPTVVYWQRLEF